VLVKKSALICKKNSLYIQICVRIKMEDNKEIKRLEALITDEKASREKLAKKFDAMLKSERIATAYVLRRAIDKEMREKNYHNLVFRCQNCRADGIMLSLGCEHSIYCPKCIDSLGQIGTHKELCMWCKVEYMERCTVDIIF
jgi:hypothetical protein